MILNSILSSPIKSMAFSGRDERLGVGLEDGILALLRPDSDWESVGEIDQSESCVSCQDWASEIFACGRINGSVTLFDTDQVFSNFFVPIAEFTSNYPVRSLAFDSNGRFLAIGNDNGVVSILSAKSSWTLFNQMNLGYSILSIKWSPAGRYMAVAGANRTFCVYDILTWTTVKEVKETLSSLLSDKEMSISCLDWSLDSKWMAIGALRSGIHVLDTSNWTLLELSTNGDVLSAANKDL
jgi:WD40 repeat protein